MQRAFIANVTGSGTLGRDWRFSVRFQIEESECVQRAFIANVTDMVI